MRYLIGLLVGAKAILWGLLKRADNKYDKWSQEILDSEIHESFFTEEG